jgi:hypothetical protein
MTSLQTLASGILAGKDADAWHHDLVQIAGEFLIDTVPLNLPPLEAKFEQLGLSVV